MDAQQAFECFESLARKYRGVLLTFPMVCGDKYCRRFHSDPGVAVINSEGKLYYFAVSAQHGHGAVVSGGARMWEVTRDEALERWRRLSGEFFARLRGIGTFVSWQEVLDGGVEVLDVAQSLRYMKPVLDL